MKHSLWSTLGVTLLGAFLTGMSVAAFTNYEKVKFCQYAVEFSRTQNDIMVSQRAGYNNLELIECDGQAKIIRDDKNQVQNFTIFFPQKKYDVTVKDASSVTNVTFIRKGEVETSAVAPAPVKSQDIIIK